MPCKQYFTQSIGFLFYTIIEIIWTFLSTQNILYRWGNKSLFTWKIFVPPKVNLVRFEQYCIVSLSSFSYTLLEQIRRYLSLQNTLFLQNFLRFILSFPESLTLAGIFCQPKYACLNGLKFFYNILQVPLYFNRCLINP